VKIVKTLHFPNILFGKKIFALPVSLHRFLYKLVNIQRQKRFVHKCNNFVIRKYYATYRQGRHSLQDLLSSSLLSKSTKIKIYRTLILPVVLYGCETWSLTLREEHRLRVFEISVLRRIFGPRRDELTGECPRLRNEELNDLYHHQILFGLLNQEEWGGWGM
jgi:hypothetical protein